MFEHIPRKIKTSKDTVCLYYHVVKILKQFSSYVFTGRTGRLKLFVSVKIASYTHM